MKKVGLVAIIVVMVVITYVVLTASMPAIHEIMVTANATANATADNYSAYEGIEEAITAAPLYLYFIPAIVGGVLIVITLKSGEAPIRRRRR